jgi:hypothetical protein
LPQIRTVWFDCVDVCVVVFVFVGIVRERNPRAVRLPVGLASQGVHDLPQIRAIGLDREKTTVRRSERNASSPSAFLTRTENIAGRKQREPDYENKDERSWGRESIHRLK